MGAVGGVTLIAAGQAAEPAFAGAAGVDEQWVAGEVGPGAWRVRSTRIAAAPVSRLEVDARWSAEVFPRGWLRPRRPPACLRTRPWC